MTDGLGLTHDEAGDVDGAAVLEGSRETSTIAFPYDDLDAAIQVAHGVHARGGRCAPDELAAELNYSGVNNGAFRVRVATARIFGVIATGRGTIELTVLGRRIVDPQQQAAARVDAFLTVPLYRSVYDRYRGGTLPPPAGLEKAFAEMGVAAKQTDKARQAFQRSAQSAGFFNSGQDRLVTPVLPTSPDATAQGMEEPPAKLKNDEDVPGWVFPPAFNESLIRGLVEKLPDPGSEWSVEKQDQWLALAKSIFAMVYTVPMRQLPAPQSQGPSPALVDVGQVQ